MTDVDRQTLIVYLWYSAPIQWVSWQHEAHDERAKQQLENVLADPGTGSLRDLRDLSMRRQVIGVVLRNKVLRSLILRDARQCLDGVTDRIAEELKAEKGRIRPVGSWRKAKKVRSRLRTRERRSLLQKVAAEMGHQESEP
jgi:hypothetical protein